MESAGKCAQEPSLAKSTELQTVGNKRSGEGWGVYECGKREEGNVQREWEVEKIKADG